MSKADGENFSPLYLRQSHQIIILKKVNQIGRAKIAKKSSTIVNDF